MRNNRFVSFVVRPRVEGWDVGVGFYIVTFAHFVIAIPGIGMGTGYQIKMLLVCTWSWYQIRCCSFVLGRTVYE